MTLDNVVDYDFKVGAYEIVNPHNWCSADAEFSTINASPDEDAGSCWPNGPNYNRWFRFQATTPDIAVQVRTGGIEGRGKWVDEREKLLLAGGIFSRFFLPLRKISGI